MSYSVLGPEKSFTVPSHMGRSPVRSGIGVITHSSSTGPQRIGQRQLQTVLDSSAVPCALEKQGFLRAELAGLKLATSRGAVGGSGVRLPTTGI